MISQHYSLLLFSKYSPSCTQLFGMMNNSRVDFSELKTLCIDNENIRKRIKNNKKLEINTVPCLLTIHSDGKVEKFEGTNVLNWITNFIQERLPPPPPPVQQPVQQPKPIIRRPVQRQVGQEVGQEINPEEDLERGMRQDLERPERQRRVRITEPSRIQQRPDYPEDEESEREPRAEPRQDSRHSTSIMNIPMEDEEVPRHKNVAKPKRLPLDDSGRYIEGEDLFGGEMPENTNPPKNTLKNTAKSQEKDPFGTLQRAKELAQGRDSLDQEFSNQSKRPVSARRP